MGVSPMSPRARRPCHFICEADNHMTDMKDPPKRILVIGHLGLLGRALMDRLGDRATGVDVEQCNVTQPDAIERTLDDARPDAVINCAAYTAVDQAESEPEAARRLNANVVELLGRAAQRRDLHFVTLSTDYVFGGWGEEPFDEDAPEEAFAPESVYGRTKLEGERRLRAVGGRWCIARTQWLYGEGGGNFVDTIAREAARRESLRVVNDQVGAPTLNRDLAGALEALVDHRATGCYHTANSGYGSWYDVALHVVERLGLDCRVDPCTSEKYPRPAKRPKNSRLSQRKFIELTGAPLRHWTEALDQYLDQRL